MQYADLAQFVVFRGASDYRTLKSLVKEFVSGKKILGDHHPFNMSPPPKKVISRSKTPEAPQMEEKVDQLAEQLSKLALFVKKSQTPASQANKDEQRLCTYCQKPGHYSTRCLLNPHRDTRCGRCGKNGHSIVNCWVRNPNQDKRAGFDGAKSESQQEERWRDRTLEAAIEEQQKPSQVSVVTVGDLEQEEPVTVTKRNAEGAPIPKQIRTEDRMGIRSLLNSNPQSRAVRPQGDVTGRGKRSEKARKTS
eukprot:gb/GEZJ01005436.1/.p1 GENE.gb/GEZJ01005436.1/~~gb/GEZJ01005436.1/.p1  ORF type:complete len:250 (-),score=29.54 gb/GEZJ01005436.1/:2825-3574(-)